jgi:hypothetical protein
MEVELFEQRRWDNGGVGVALIRDGNGTRSFETLLRYRSAATAEFMRALRTLKALQAEAAATGPSLADPTGPTPRPAIEGRRQPNEPERRPLHEYIIPDPPGAGRTLHEPAAPWMPNEPEAERPARLNQRQIPAEPPLVSRPQRLRSRERQVHAASCRTNRSALAGTNPGPDERAQAALLRRTPLPLVSIALLRGLKRA